MSRGRCGPTMAVRPRASLTFAPFSTQRSADGSSTLGRFDSCARRARQVARLVPEVENLLVAADDDQTFQETSLS